VRLGSRRTEMEHGAKVEKLSARQCAQPRDPACDANSCVSLLSDALPPLHPIRLFAFEEMFYHRRARAIPPDAALRTLCLLLPNAQKREFLLQIAKASRIRAPQDVVSGLA
jgi:hypothetical protein